jgi:cobyrinic acid a,c-diamide synthase
MAYSSIGNSHPQLESYLMTQDVLTKNFCNLPKENDFVIIEGNMGLYDGLTEAEKEVTAHLQEFPRPP